MSRVRALLPLVLALPVLVLVGVLRAYQLLVSPMLGPTCRYAPSCSSYAVTALRTHGAVRGCWLAGRRVLHCHPWAAGGWDPVPERPRARSGPHRAPPPPGTDRPTETATAAETTRTP